MEAMISSSSSPNMKLVSSCSDKNMCFKDDVLGKSMLKLSLDHSNKIKYGGLKLSVSVSSIRRSVSLSCSHTQVEVENQQILIEESSNECINEVEAQTVRVKFQLQRECSFGQHFLITGDDPMLGSWDPNKAIPLTWSDDHVWTIDLNIPIGKCIKFKFIMQESDGMFLWQPGPDRILECFETDKVITIFEDWESPEYRRIVETDSTLNQELQTVAVSEGMPVEPSVSTIGTEDPKGYEIDIKDVLVADEELPVLVPGFSELTTMDADQKVPVKEASDNEPEPINGDVADLKLKLQDDEPEHTNEATIDLNLQDDEPENTDEATMNLNLQDDEPEHSNGVTMDIKLSDDEPKRVNAAVIDLNLPELDLKENSNTSNLNPSLTISSVQENQDSYENKDQEMHQAAEEADHQAIQPMKIMLLNVIQWGNNFMQKLLNVFGIP